MPLQELASTIKKLVVPGKGILAADESTATITKRLESIQVECTPETRCHYREMLFTTAGLQNYISGVILYEETLTQKNAQGRKLIDILIEKGIVPGIKVDKGLVALPYSLDEKTTQGLDDLATRLTTYQQQGARFAKWRAVYAITEQTPSHLTIHTNAEGLAQYAAICQQQGIVPIVEPEVLIEGKHSLQQCADVSEQVLHAVFHALHKHRVKLELIILKPSMVIPGLSHQPSASIHEIAAATLQVLRRTVPAAVPSINFLSGGQTPEQATAHLNAMNALGPHPWHLSFSYARALQEPAMKAWKGHPDQVKHAQDIFYKRAHLNGLASQGQYSETME